MGADWLLRSRLVIRTTSFGKLYEGFQGEVIRRCYAGGSVMSGEVEQGIFRPHPDTIQVLRPSIQILRFRRRERFSRRPRPPNPEKVPKRSSGIPLNSHLHVVERGVGPTIRIDSPKVVGFVLRRVPARFGQIEPPDESHGIVDHDDLVVMAGTLRPVAHRRF